MFELLEEIVNGQNGRAILMSQIVTEQTGRIRDEFARKKITVNTGFSVAGEAFMYAEGQILVLQDAAEQVLAILSTKVVPDAGEEVIEGVKLFHFGPQGPGPAPTVLDVLGEIDRQVGPGVAAPNYVLTAAANPTPESGPCPATEPEEAYFDIEPFPGVREVDDGSDGHGVRIYVADTGILNAVKKDPSLFRWLKGVDGGDDPLDPKPRELIQPYCAHGTFVAGVVRCMAPKAYVYVSNVFQVAGSALESDFVKDLADALTQNYDIFNLSVTTPSKGVLRLLGFEAWLKIVDRDYPDVAVVAAAGNDGQTAKCWPAAYPEVVSVGALAADWRTRAHFSNYGPWVKVYAPGRDLVNAFATGIYECRDDPYAGQIRRFYGMCKWSGTSFSTPLVTGLIAARMSRASLKAKEAALSLLTDAARDQTMPHLGPIVKPYDNKFAI